MLERPKTVLALERWTFETGTPVIIRATLIITEGLKKYLGKVPGEHSTDTVQKKQIC
jgi:hypothetical protein